MLKALELVGFKSFADKTVFEFSKGITGVVGPNGSGKSNVVDAIKWVLGEQSVKSLRGKEMADVIFNGSASRQPLNTAEVTLTFDNAQRLLPLDMPEVHVTRRVYRSGEGEYLINRQPSRLRDIRDLFAGTGFGSEAYGVIEQGKVDVLLQSSPKERRLIFEEAAGISRFKAKKIEAQRRLERVEQNLLRLSDIVSEVESRLRSVRSQASKARRYREHADRLQQLRTQVGLADWRKLSEQLAAAEAELQSVSGELSASNAAADAAEARTAQLDAAQTAKDNAVRDVDNQLAQHRQQIAAEETTIRHETARCADLSEEMRGLRSRLAAMSLRAGDLRQQWQETLAQVASAQATHSRALERLTADESRLQERVARLSILARDVEAIRAAHAEQLRTAALAAQNTSGLESQIESTTALVQRLEARLAELSDNALRWQSQLEHLQREQGAIEQSIEIRQTEIEKTRQRLVDSRRQLTAQTAQLHQLRQQHAGASERAAVLSELESRLEGVQAGVKHVLVSAKRSPEGPFRAVRGLVADLLRAEPDMAPLIDLILGDRAQLLVVGKDPDLPAVLEREGPQFKGRVGFLRLDLLSSERSDSQVDLNGQPGVVERADRIVETTTELLPLARHLLAGTWIVQTLQDALNLARQAPGTSFATLAGELVGADGTLSVGPRSGPAGLFSRRSELRALREAISDLEATLGQLVVSVERLERQTVADEQHVNDLLAEHGVSIDRLAQHRLEANEVRLRLMQGVEQQTHLRSECAAAVQRIERAQGLLVDARGQRETAEAELTALETRRSAALAQVAALSAERQDIQQAATCSQIELAKSEERLQALAARQSQLERDHRERERALDDGRAQLTQVAQRLAQSERQTLEAESRLALLYLAKEKLEAQVAGLTAEREEQRAARIESAATAQQLRAVCRKHEERHHALQLAAHEVRHQRQTLVDRLRDDYNVDLAELSHEPSAEELNERETVEQEIGELRRKINNLGNVNLDALAELEELEGRFKHLSEQHNDLVQAKNQIAHIINKINSDSRRLFVETLETVKANFQSLFRKLFGGGQADIILEENVDMLDSGIEIIARPPGKEPRNISLLSGGEKTLTCVALLLAVFQYRPSPFCVLDEVDAALDEANIERFIVVLQEFLAWTQFIVVTHSKKTMTCASTLYGVTMEESGVSKRVAVRFEDMSSTGELTAPASSESPAADGTQAA